MFCMYHCGLEAKFTLENGKLCCSDHFNKCPEMKRKNSEGLKQSYQNGRYSYFKDGANLNRNWAKGKHSWNDPRIKSIVDINQLFSYTPTHRNGIRKAFLIDERGYKCEKCGISTWLENPITLEMDHIDGDTKNNVKENLKLLCPNCHSQTITWKRGKSLTRKQTSDDDFIEALQTTENIHQALIKLGMTPKGANYIRAKKLASTIPTTVQV